jgi:hypothetical protein
MIAGFILMLTLTEMHSISKTKEAIPIKGTHVPLLTAVTTGEDRGIETTGIGAGGKPLHQIMKLHYLQ